MGGGEVVGGEVTGGLVGAGALFAGGLVGIDPDVGGAVDGDEFVFGGVVVVVVTTAAPAETMVLSRLPFG